MRIRQAISNFLTVAASQGAAVAGNGVYFLAVAAIVSKFDLGEFAFISACVSALTMAMGCGTQFIVTQRLTRSDLHPGTVMGASLLHKFTIGVVFAIAGPAVISLIPKIGHQWPLWAMAIIAWNLASMTATLRAALIAREQFKRNVVGIWASLLSKFTLGLTLAWLGYGVKALLVALLVGNGIGLIVVLVLVGRLYGFLPRPRLAWSELRLQLRHGAPLLINDIITLGHARFDWILLGFYLPPEVLATYAISYRIYEASQVPGVALNVMSYPVLCRVARRTGDTGASSAKVADAFKVVVAVSSFLPLIVAVAWSGAIEAITLGKYGAETLVIAYVLLCGALFEGPRGFYYNLAVANHKRHIPSMVLTIATGLNILINIIFIPRYGLIAAAVATTIALVCQYVMYSWLMRSYVKPSVGIWFTLRVLLLSIAVGIPFSQWTSLHWWWRGLLAVAAFGAAGWLLRLFSPKLIARFRRNPAAEEGQDGSVALEPSSQE